MSSNQQLRSTPSHGRSLRTRRSAGPSPGADSGVEPPADERGDADPGEVPRAGAAAAGASLPGPTSKTCDVAGERAGVESVVSTDGPWLLTVEQTARLLQIGRTLAYELVGRFEDSGGAVGIPVVRIGGTLRVPRDELVDQIRSGRVNGDAGSDDELAVRRRPVDHAAAGGNRAAGRVSSGRRRSGGPGPDQPPLFPAV